MGLYEYLLVDASSGSNLCPLPTLAVSSFSRVLNGVGVLSGTLPLDVTLPPGVTLTGDREITVLRNGVPVWNGPITMLEGSLLSREIQVSAREFSWYLGKRTLEIDKHYNDELFFMVRNLLNNMVVKTSNGTIGGTNINANLPRFTTLPTGGSGITKQTRYYGSARHTFAEILDDLVADPSNGLDYRVDYTTGSTRQTVQRTVTLGAPLGSQKTQQLTEHVLYDFGKTEDRERAATRVHGLGSGYTYTLQNTGAVAAGEVLIESVYPRTDTADHTAIQNFTADARKLAQPPVTVFTVSFVPGSATSALPYGFCELGDSVNVQVGGATWLAASGYRRVVEITVAPGSGDVPELVTLGLNVPIDSLGA